MRILIVEDEAVAARGLERMVKEILGKKITWIGCASTLELSKILIAQQTIDLLFLDLNLNGEPGFELLHEAVAGSFHTIIVSANEDQALKAFDYGVLDFVSKPVSPERLRRAIDRLSNLQDTGKGARYIPIRKTNGIKLMPVDQISYFCGDSNYVEVHLKAGGLEYIRKTIEAIEKILPGNFQRIHRSYLVDTRNIQKITTQSGGKYHVELVQGVALPLSRLYYPKLKEMIDLN